MVDLVFLVSTVCLVWLAMRKAGSARSGFEKPSYFVNCKMLNVKSEMLKNRQT
jgi:hypothetical protein